MREYSIENKVKENSSRKYREKKAAITSCCRLFQ